MERIEKKLREWVTIYETENYISEDPVWFPHQYKEKCDVEISAFITSWISYGNRKAIVSKAKEIDSLFERTPYQYIIKRKYASTKNSVKSLYRFYKYADFFDLCERLYQVYSDYRDMEEAVIACDASKPLQALRILFKDVKGIPDPDSKSACKRLAMFLRWMVRQESVVDFGIWKEVDACNLIIPLDVHVYEEALELKITSRRTPDMQTAIEITDYFKKLYPTDPAKGDFALFGYGINKKKEY
jgi:uncharacterized protein (TIGR02757 family)